MKTSLKWLKDYLDITLSAEELADRLTMAGLEVKSTQVTGGAWENVVVAEIKAINPHPNADRLTLPTVDLGTEQVSVVCGAPNLQVGQKVAFARVGAELVDPHTGDKSRLKAAKIRGIISAGMVCSEKELGISDDHTGILVLPPDAPVGTPLADYMSDALFNLEITPNRPDCLSVIGIAREAAALTGKAVRLPDDRYAEVDPPVEQQVALEISAPDLCPRYCATLIKGVKIAESPVWMQHRLMAGGMRPINNIVDITNFVMLEYGQPLHSFDYDAITGKKIIVRRARSGEKLTTLDGSERELASSMLVIADTERAVALAGVMGGANTEVTDRTTSILLESANFNSTSIHYTSRTLGAPSEASMRFERGIRPDLTVPALKRATRLIKELAGGEVAKGIVDVFPGEKERQAVALSTDRVKRCLGVEFSREQVIETLTSLGFECRAGSGPKELTAVAPYWRSDIRLPEDLIEEVARIRGYDTITTTMLSQPIPRQDPSPVLRLKKEIRGCLTGYGFQELLSPSLVGIEALNKVTAGAPGPQALRLSNPMTTEQEYLRTTLRANVLTALAANRRFEEAGIRLFEVSRVYVPRENDLPDERDMLCGVINGPITDRWWQGGGAVGDFFAAKGAVEGVLKRLNVEASFEPGADPGLHPANQAAVVAGGNRIGAVGEVHPKVRESFEIAGTAYLFELDLPALIPLAKRERAYNPIPRFPAVVRDIAVVVDLGVTHKQVLDLICGLPLVDSVALFDVYSGEQVPPGKKSLAYRLTFQSPTKTLTDEEVSDVMRQVVEKLAGELGATLRA
ncbi:MAG: phenylalanine--tRNA ligase subunit beta [Chloroflexi bacterium RBG_16_57_8]|nr:MAG: phenylalanine--tRNA ligase subunit beta [Chloroflexi bacterium RBG_16_57_8]